MGQQSPGQAPEAPANPGDPQTPVTPPEQAPATPTTPPADPAPTSQEQSIDDLPKWAQDQIKELRRGEANYRTKYQEASTKLTELERAALTEQERIQYDLKTLQETVLPEKDQTIRQLQVQVAAQKQGVVDPEAVVSLLDWSKVGDGTSIDAAINELLERKPYLKAPATQPTTPPPAAPPSQTSPASPGSGGSATQATYTVSQLQSMSAAEYERNRDSIQAALKAGLVKKD